MCLEKESNSELYDGTSLFSSQESNYETNLSNSPIAQKQDNNINRNANWLQIIFILWIISVQNFENNINLARDAEEYDGLAKKEFEENHNSTEKENFNTV